MITNRTGWRGDNDVASRVVERKMAHVTLSGEYLDGGEPVPVWSETPNSRLVGMTVWPRWHNGRTVEWNGDSIDPRLVVITRRGVPMTNGEPIIPAMNLTVEAIMEAG